MVGTCLMNSSPTIITRLMSMNFLDSYQLPSSLTTLFTFLPMNSSFSFFLLSIPSTKSE